MLMPSCRTAFAVIMALGFVASAYSQEAQSDIPQAGQPVHGTIIAATFSPASPVAGQTVTVNYSITEVGIGGVSGSIGGSYNGAELKQADGSNPPDVQINPWKPFAGSLVIPAPPSGQGKLVLRLYTPAPPNCTLSFQNRVFPCPPKVIASKTLLLTVAPPMVTVRIAGSSYSTLATPDQHGGDVTSSQYGYLFVMHDPDCAPIFGSGNDGKDHYFVGTALPPGAILVGVDFDQFWPADVDSATGSGAWTWLDSSGTYYAHLNQDVPSQPFVKWNNTCAGGFGGRKLWYAISFRIRMPKGTDLGEPAFDINTPAGDPPAGYSESPVSLPAQSTAPSGWAGQVVYCNINTSAIDSGYLHIRASLVQAIPQAQGSAGPLKVDNLLVKFAPSGSAGSVANFSTPTTFQQGTWNITDVYLTQEQTATGAPAPSDAIHLPGLSATPSFHVLLPGNAGSPRFDFTDGSCPVP